MKTFMHLTTGVDTLEFNHDSCILAMGSHRKKDSLKLVRERQRKWGGVTSCLLRVLVRSLHATASTVAGSCSNTVGVCQLADQQDTHLLPLRCHLQPQQRYVSVLVVCHEVNLLNHANMVTVVSVSAGFLAMGNDRGRALLYRLNHYLTA